MALGAPGSWAAPASRAARRPSPPVGQPVRPRRGNPRPTTPTLPCHSCQSGCWRRCQQCPGQHSHRCMWPGLESAWGPGGWAVPPLRAVRGFPIGLPAGLGTLARSTHPLHIPWGPQEHQGWAWSWHSPMDTRLLHTPGLAWLQPPPSPAGDEPDSPGVTAAAPRRARAWAVSGCPVVGLWGPGCAPQGSLAARPEVPPWGG